jgi:arabinogalactan endo-1,4-beta-galactosidase
MKKTILISVLFFTLAMLQAQQTYFGVDLSYVNEMEDCGADFKENNVSKDVYEIFADHNCDLVRLRLWHSPSWYDNLNSGNRYSDLADVKRSIQRAKGEGMKVLLDFHLSDTWADPGNQVVPAAWSAVVDSLDRLKDSLYNYIYRTLDELDGEGLLPEMVQIGNETNKGILLSQAANGAGWQLDWTRNAALFNEAIRAVRDIEAQTNKTIQVMIHIADPKHADWYTENFISNGVTDFDIVGISYYHQWHGDNSIIQVGTIIENLIRDHGKDVMIVETGYPWTSGWDDNASNIISTAHPSYSPLSPAQQKRWLTDLSTEVLASGGIGLIYWEPAWVSTNCSSQWAQGSHYENATFFDFQDNLQPDGGIEWLEKTATSIEEVGIYDPFDVSFISNQEFTFSNSSAGQQGAIDLNLYNLNGQLILNKEILPTQAKSYYQINPLPKGIYYFQLMLDGNPVKQQKAVILD